MKTFVVSWSGLSHCRGPCAVRVLQTVLEGRECNQVYELRWSLSPMAASSSMQPPTLSRRQSSMISESVDSQQSFDDNVFEAEEDDDEEDVGRATQQEQDVVLSAVDLVAEQQIEIDKLVGLFGITRHAASVLLRAYKWKVSFCAQLDFAIATAVVDLHEPRARPTGRAAD